MTQASGNIILKNQVKRMRLTGILFMIMQQTINLKMPNEDVMYLYVSQVGQVEHIRNGTMFGSRPIFQDLDLTKYENDEYVYKYGLYSRSKWMEEVDKTAIRTHAIVNSSYSSGLLAQIRMYFFLSKMTRLEHDKFIILTNDQLSDVRNLYDDIQRNFSETCAPAIYRRMACGLGRALDVSAYETNMKNGISIERHMFIATGDAGPRVVEVDHPRPMDAFMHKIRSSNERETNLIAEKGKKLDEREKKSDQKEEELDKRECKLKRKEAKLIRFMDPTKSDVKFEGWMDGSEKDFREQIRKLCEMRNVMSTQTREMIDATNKLCKELATVNDRQKELDQREAAVEAMTEEHLRKSQECKADLEMKETELKFKESLINACEPAKLKAADEMTHDFNTRWAALGQRVIELNKWETEVQQKESSFNAECVKLKEAENGRTEALDRKAILLSRREADLNHKDNNLNDQIRHCQDFRVNLEQREVDLNKKITATYDYTQSVKEQVEALMAKIHPISS